MATYRDTLTALNANTVAHIYENNTNVIDGDVHQTQDLTLANSFYGNLLPLQGDAFRIVRGGTTATAVDNFAALAAAYAEAKLLTPYGNALSATNRATVLLMPGIYDAGATGLTLDAQYVDIVGIGSKRDVVVTSGSTFASGGTVKKTANDIRLENFTIANTNAGHITAAYYGSASYPAERFTDMVFTDDGSATGLGMRKDNLFDGTYKNCICTTAHGFRSTTSTIVDVAGTFTDCSSGTTSFGGNRTGSHVRCTSTGDAFGTSSSTAYFEDCKATGKFASVGPLVGTYLRCTGGNNSFLAAASVTATLSGSFTECIGGDTSFGTAASSTLSGTFNRCTGGAYSFGGSGSVLSGTFTSCTALDHSFAYLGSITGTLNHCTAGSTSFAYGFGGSSSISGTLNYCTGGGTSFAAGGGNITSTAVFNHCTGGASCFGVALSTIVDGTYNYCVAGDGSFGNAVAVGTSINGKYYKCIGGNNSFGYTNGMSVTFTGTATQCIGGNNCFASSTTAAVGNSATASGKFIDCVAGSFSFGATTGTSGSNAIASGTFIRCIAGISSFASAGGDVSGYVATASGYFEDCAASNGSFAGQTQGTKSGVFVRCCIRLANVIGGTTDPGPLTGRMTDCEWVMTTAATPALLVQDGAKVYGGRYIPGAGATASIASATGAALNAKIANIMTTVALDANITNLISSPNVIVDADV
jgi:hypothetical protein